VLRSRDRVIEIRIENWVGVDDGRQKTIALAQTLLGAL
jgi:hypothetical protein